MLPLESMSLVHRPDHQAQCKDWTHLTHGDIYRAERPNQPAVEGGPWGGHGDLPGFPGPDEASNPGLGRVSVVP